MAPDEDPRDDRALLAAHVAGDSEAFGLLFARHRDRLWAVALRTAGDPDLAADALQEGLIAAFRRAASFRGDAAVTTWLHRIVVNATLDLHRRNAVRAADPLPEHGAEAAALEAGRTPGAALSGPDPRADPAQALLSDERRQEVLAALRQLPADQRAALVLVDMEGWPVAEAAQLLDCAPGTVKSRCSRGRVRLAALLAKGQDGAPRPQTGNLQHASPVSPSSSVPPPAPRRSAREEGSP